jgi:hypothetical protein
MHFFYNSNASVCVLGSTQALAQCSVWGYVTLCIVRPVYEGDHFPLSTVKF